MNSTPQLSRQIFPATLTRKKPLKRKENIKLYVYWLNLKYNLNTKKPVPKTWSLSKLIGNRYRSTKINSIKGSRMTWFDCIGNETKSSKTIACFGVSILNENIQVCKPVCSYGTPPAPNITKIYTIRLFPISKPFCDEQNYYLAQKAFCFRSGVCGGSYYCRELFLRDL